MERIFPNPCRFSFGKRARCCTCLLVRSQEVLLTCHCNRDSSVAGFLDVIERLGGIEGQRGTEGGQWKRSCAGLPGGFRQRRIPDSFRRVENLPP